MQPPNVRGFHPTVLRLSLVVRRLPHLVLATKVPHCSSGFHCFQDRDDLMSLNLPLRIFGLLAMILAPETSSFSMALFVGEGYRTSNRSAIRNPLTRTE